MEGIDSFFPYRSLHRPVSLLCLPYICRLPLGLISSDRAEAVGHSISTLCMLSVPALPFSPFFLQRQRKKPQLPTCQEEMSHRQPLDFSQRLFCGCAPRPLAQSALSPTQSSLTMCDFCVYYYYHLYNI